MASRPSVPLTIACRDEDFTDWRRGRTHAVAWVVMLERPGLRALLSDARGALAGYLLPRHQRQPHLTIAYRGLLPGPDPATEGADDDYTARHLEADLALLRGLPTPPLRLTATGWGTFPMVPYLALANDWTHRANELLLADLDPSLRMPYQPHVTIGHYAGRWPLTEPIRRLDALAPRGCWEAAELSLVRFRADDIAGPLEELGRLDVTTGRWRHPPLPAAPSSPFA